MVRPLEKRRKHLTPVLITQHSGKNHDRTLELEATQDRRERRSSGRIVGHVEYPGGTIDVLHLNATWPIHA